ncbi:hypothetical protein P8452_71507 [Trifolium repens]|nr:hypothetical protein P8452_71507 [Trifolium repens]
MNEMVLIIPLFPERYIQKQVVLRPVTKDEQEVTETLYALAGMFSINDSSAENELDCKSLSKNSSVSHDQEESANATFEASGVIEDANLIPESSHRETIDIEHTDFPQSHKHAMCTENGAGSTRDEVDFEFMGNRAGQPYLLQTNLYKNRTGKSLSIGQKNGVFTQQVTFHITTGKPR